MKESRWSRKSGKNSITKRWRKRLAKRLNDPRSDQDPSQRRKRKVTGMTGTKSNPVQRMTSTCQTC